MDLRLLIRNVKDCSLLSNSRLFNKLAHFFTSSGAKISVVFISIFFTACIPKPDYTSMTACQKEAIVWDKVVASEYTEELPVWQGNESSAFFLRVLLQYLSETQQYLEAFKNDATNYLKVTVFHDKDEVPAVPFFQKQRTRIIHPFGAVAKVKFVADEGQPFTGLYEGVDCGVVRLSLAGPPTPTQIIPAMAVKFFIDEQASANFVAMNSLSLQTGFNFFKMNFSNFIPESDNIFVTFIANIFKLVSDDPFKVDVSLLASTDESGETIDNPDAPWQLILKPNTADLAFADEAHEFRDDLHSIPENTTLYTVYGIRRGSTTEIRIGELVTKSEFISSSYGDGALFFRHQRIDDVL